MKLIVSHLESLSRYITREFYYLTKDLVSTFGWQHIEISKLWDGPGTTRDNLIEEFGELPETILFWEAYEFLQAHAREIQSLKCHKVFLADDLHWWNEPMRQMKVVSFALCDTLVSTYAYRLTEFYPELSGWKKIVFVPHSASPDFLLAYNPCPENSIFLSGAMTHYYPLRRRMLELHQLRCYPIAYHDHPGYLSAYDHDRNEAIGPGYARKINNHRIAFTDCLTFKYVVAKYFEIPATGSLLLADNGVRQPLMELGFIENIHYIPVSKETLEDRVRFVLDEGNQEELDHIRRKGQELVWKNHKTSDRARQINEICV